MALIFKDGVRLYGHQPEALLALDRANDVFAEVGADCIVTSGRGDKHGAYSHHYKGLADDCRSWHLKSQAEKDYVLARLKEVLGEDYQVLFELRPTEHFHIEYDPRHKPEYPSQPPC